jgi:hypothetical protein
MPSKSKSQQRLMGMVHAYQIGKLKKDDVNSDELWEKIKKMSKTMKKKDSKEFAETKHKGLPEVKEKNVLTYDEFLNENDEEYRYLSDEEIESGYKDFKIREFKMWSDAEGMLDIEFPNGEDKVDNFIIYEDGRIAFDHWYPSEIYSQLVDYINNQLNKNN